MSIDHVSKVLTLGPEVTGTTRMVAFVLAEAANHDTDECWPGVSTLCKRAGLRQERYVTKAVAQLVELGLVTVDPNGCPDMRIRADRRPNLYRLVGVLAVAHGGARRDTPLPDTGVRDAPHGGARRAGTGVRDAQSAPYTEPEVQPELQPSPDFDAFWSVYPRKVGKPEAARAWRHVTKAGADPSVVVEGLAAWARYWSAVRTEQQFIPHPATWLRQERFNDAPPQTRPGGQRGAVTVDRGAPTGRVVDL